MVKESVALDVHEIEKIDKSFMRFKNDMISLWFDTKKIAKRY